MSFPRESYVTPGDPRCYATPTMVAMRHAPGAACCTDPECDLSGGYAHVGDCTPCSCGDEHAEAECPALVGAAS